MNKKTFLATLLACVMLMMCGLSAQAASPVKWSATAEMTSETEGVLTISADIEAGWHVYGTKMPDDGPAPSKFYVSGKGVRLISSLKASPKPTKEEDPMFGITLSYWANKVTLTGKFQLVDPAADTINVTVEYMCCNDSNCRPPQKETIVVNIKK